jgi:hypothetical protein
MCDVPSTAVFCSESIKFIIIIIIIIICTRTLIYDVEIALQVLETTWKQD